MYVFSAATLRLLSDWVPNLSLCVWVCVCAFPADPTSSIWRDKSSSDLTAPLCPPYAQTRLCVTLQTVCVTVCPLAHCSLGMSVCVCFSCTYCVRAWRHRNIFVTPSPRHFITHPNVGAADLCRSEASCSEPPIVAPLVRQTAHNRDCLSVHSTTEHY